MFLKRQENGQIVQQKLPGCETPIKKYSKGRLLGKGGFAKCYEFTSLESNRKYAAKIIEKASLNKSKAKEKLGSEIKIHRSLNHQNIVGFEHCFQDTENVYILLEMCPNQTLNQLLKRRKRLTELEAQYYLYQVADAVNYLHSQKIIHRDLKLGNLFLSDKLEIKIGDFGLATKLNYDGQMRKTMCGTPNYIAPEILVDKNGHSYQVDSWSLGVIAYALLVGKPPFQTHDVKLTYSKIKSCSYSFPQALQISDKAKFFVSKLLQLEPSKRLTLQQALNDSFFTLNEIPASLPISTLACPPNANFLRQFQRQDRCTQSQSNKKQTIQTQHEAFNNSKESRTSIKVIVADRFQNKGSSVEKGLPLSTTKAFGSAQKALSTAALIYLKKTQCWQKPIKQFIWITYFQENPKFGICYMLSSNAVGMKFNDSTSLVSNSHLTRMRYIEFDGQLQPKESVAFGSTEAPQALMKKMKIISHYQRQLREKKNNQETCLNNEVRIQKERLKYRQTSQDSMSFYIKRYVRDSSATLFWMNNDDVHAIFQDGGRLIVSKTQGIYLSRYFQKTEFPVSEFRNENQDIKKRMFYMISITGRLKTKKVERRSGEKQKQNGQSEIYNVKVSKCPSSSNLDPKHRSLRKSENLLKVCMSMNKLLTLKRISTGARDDS